jgi:hypothetical protein
MTTALTQPVAHVHVDHEPSAYPTPPACTTPDVVIGACTAPANVAVRGMEGAQIERQPWCPICGTEDDLAAEHDDHVLHPARVGSAIGSALALVGEQR